MQRFTLSNLIDNAEIYFIKLDWQCRFTLSNSIDNAEIYFIKLDW